MTWKLYAACVGVDTNVFFDSAQQAKAKRICHACPVISECYEAYADEVHGVFGGTDPRERGIQQRAKAHPPRYDATERQLVLTLYQSGMGVKSVAKATAIGEETVQSFIRTAGLKRHNAHNNATDDPEIRIRYLVQYLSPMRVARYTSSPLSMVYRIKKEEECHA